MPGSQLDSDVDRSMDHPAQRVRLEVKLGDSGERAQPRRECLPFRLVADDAQNPFADLGIAEDLARMKPTALLVNTSRAPRRNRVTLTQHADLRLEGGGRVEHAFGRDGAATGRQNGGRIVRIDHR
jgi:hypothetical protein